MYIGRAPKYIKKIFTYIKGDIESNTIIVGDFKYIVLFAFLLFLFLAVPHYMQDLSSPTRD